MPDPKEKAAPIDFSSDARKSVDWKEGETTNATTGKVTKWARKGVNVGGKAQVTMVANMREFTTKKGEPRLMATIVTEKWTSPEKKEQVKALFDKMVKDMEALAGEAATPSGKLFNVTSPEMKPKGTTIDGVKA